MALCAKLNLILHMLSFMPVLRKETQLEQNNVIVLHCIMLLIMNYND